MGSTAVVNYVDWTLWPAVGIAIFLQLIVTGGEYIDGIKALHATIGLFACLTCMNVVSVETPILASTLFTMISLAVANDVLAFVCMCLILIMGTPFRELHILR